MTSIQPHWITKFDLLHHHRAYNVNQKRILYDHVFGTDIPAYIIFHAMLGYVLLAIGACAIVLRLPVRKIRQKRWLHSYFGYTWTFGTIWMPVTAIWCVYEYPGWDLIAFFIFSMFAAIQLAWLSIQPYRRMQEDLQTQVNNKHKRLSSVLRALHAILMIYSFIMLFGAGVSFPLRANSGYSQMYKDYYSNH